MKHDIPKYLEDVLLSIKDIENYSTGIENVTQLQNNQMLFDALCRRFAIIGEAIYQINNLDRTINITDKHKIMGLRHIIVHDYDMVRPADIFLIISKNLSLLKSETIALLEILG